MSQAGALLTYEYHALQTSNIHFYVRARSLLYAIVGMGKVILSAINKKTESLIEEVLLFTIWLLVSDVYRTFFANISEEIATGLLAFQNALQDGLFS